MKIKRLLIFILILLVIACGAFFYINKFASQKLGKLEVNSNSTMDAFIDNENLGHKFPISNTYEPKKVTVKIGDYETNVYLQAGIKTIVNRDFQNDKGYGEVISFEATGQSYGSVSAISNPAGARIIIDDKDIGTTPISIDNMSEGNHKLNISLDGYLSREFQINVYKGYKLLANFNLLQDSTAVIVQDNTVLTKEEKTIVKILETPNGFLRVRKQPTTQSDEVFRVYKDQEYELKSSNDKLGWFEIRIDATRSGWISDIYAATSSSIIKD